MSPATTLDVTRRRALPMVLASAPFETLLACLVMIGRAHGHDVDMNGLRQTVRYGLTGGGDRQLSDIAERLQLSARRVEATLGELGRLRLPAVLEWGAGQYVVLASVRGADLKIHDPLRGSRTLRADQAAQYYSGGAFEFDRSDAFEPAELRRGIRFNGLWSSLSGLPLASAQVVALTLLLQVATFIAPLQVQLVVDQAIANLDRPLLLVLAIGFGLLAVSQVVLDGVRNWTLQVLGQSVTFQLTGNIVHHLLRLPADFFERRHVGDILSRIGSVSALQDALTRGIVASLLDGLMALTAVAVLFLYSAPMALIVLASFLIILALSLLFYPVIAARTVERLQASAREQTYLMETVRGAGAIKLMGREWEREAAWRELYATVTNTSVSLGRFQTTLSVLQNLVGAVQTILVIYFGARSVIGASGFSVGMLLAFLALRQTFTDRANSLVNQSIQLRLLGLHLDRLSDIVATPPDRRSLAVAMPDITGGFEFRDVGFRYSDDGEEVLSELNLKVQAGEFVALTGRSGCGKTTLLRLLTGVHAPTSGALTFDGQRPTPGSWPGIRAQMALVAQDDRLFSGTVAENIACFDSRMDLDLVEQAAMAAHIHIDIMRMPLRYLTPIGDMGSSLSGGQKQRVLLARALYRRPRILILDEGTANLDEETEESIAEVILKLPMTRLVVAHRPALVQRADRVGVVQNGELIFPPSQRAFVTGEI